MENIFTSIRPFYILTKTLGLFPITMESPETKSFSKLNLTGVISTCLTFLFLIILIILNIAGDDVKISSSEMLSKLWRLEVFLGLLLMCVQFFYQIGKHRSIVKFIFDIHEIDQMVKKSFTAFNYNTY